jgi:glycosyltransferase involved in cell wall biosynthesis
MNIVFKAPFNAVSGYGRVVDLFLKYFPENDVTPHIIAMNGVIDSKYIPLFKQFSREMYEQCKQLIVFPMSFETDIRSTLAVLSNSRPRVVYTMHETTQVIGAAVEQFNKTHGVIVPCKWNQQTFLRDGMTIPIHVVPLGVDLQNYYFKPHQKNDHFVFGCGNGDVRKRLPDIIKCFCRAFHPRIKDVKLRVKVSKRDMFPTYTDPRVEITRTNLPIAQLAEWYWGLDAFVSVAYGEGWGLMQNEAMACGRALISPRYGGVADFFADGGGYAVNYKEVLADGPYQGTGGFWADFDADDLIDKMRWCYSNRADVRMRGGVAAHMAAKFDEKSVLPSILSVLANI